MDPEDTRPDWNRDHAGPRCLPLGGQSDHAHLGWAPFGTHTPYPRYIPYLYHEGKIPQVLILRHFFDTPLENPAAILECLLLGNQSRQRHWNVGVVFGAPIPYGTRTAETVFGVAVKELLPALGSPLLLILGMLRMNNRKVGK